MSSFEHYSDVLSRFGSLQDFGDYRKAKCPAHDDDKHSLSIAIGDKGHLVLKCHAGCSFKDVIKAAGIDVRETFMNQQQVTKPKKTGFKIAATYDYTDEVGNFLYQVVRLEPKDFRQRRKARPDDPPNKVKSGNWVWNLRDTKRVLYNLKTLHRALSENSRRIVFIVEGEKDADLLTKLGFLATTNVGGAGKWEDSYTEFLTGCNVVIIPDNDPKNEETGKCAGADHAQFVMSQLQGKAKKVVVLALDGVPEKGDISDWFELGGTVGKLKELVQNAVKGKSKDMGNQNYEHVTLSSREITFAARVGVERRTSFLLKNGHDNIGWEYSIENACGELAVAKSCNFYWDGNLEDVNGNHVNVRVRQNEQHKLIVKHHDDEDSWYAFVTGKAPEFKVWGVIWGADAKKAGRKVDDGWMVSKSKLLSPMVLFSEK